MKTYTARCREELEGAGVTFFKMADEWFASYETEIIGRGFKLCDCIRSASSAFGL